MKLTALRVRRLGREGLEEQVEQLLHDSCLMASTNASMTTVRTAMKGAATSWPLFCTQLPSVGPSRFTPVPVRLLRPHRRCAVRNGAGLRPALTVPVRALGPALTASVRCPLPLSVAWL